MATPEQQKLLQEQEAVRRAQFESFTKNLSLSLIFICPAVALLPPRKLDLYTFGLGTVWLLSANHYTQCRTGNSLGTQMLNRVASLGVGGDALPTERAQEVKRLLREKREEALREQGQLRADAQAAEADRIKKEMENRGLLEKVWMGEETEGWKERRLKEEREALQEGKGYGSLIVEQIWEVWNWGKKKEEDLEGKVQEAVKEVTEGKK